MSEETTKEQEPFILRASDGRPFIYQVVFDTSDGYDLMMGVRKHQYVYTLSAPQFVGGVMIIQRDTNTWSSYSTSTWIRTDYKRNELGWLTNNQPVTEQWLSEQKDD